MHEQLPKNIPAPFLFLTYTHAQQVDSVIGVSVQGLNGNEIVLGLAEARMKRERTQEEGGQLFVCSHTCLFVFMLSGWENALSWQPHNAQRDPADGPTVACKGKHTLIDQRRPVGCRLPLKRLEESLRAVTRTEHFTLESERGR